MEGKESFHDIWKQHKGNILKSCKIALASVIAIALAGELGLKYPASAGIITILSIQNTKRETLRSARNRGLAFLCALLLAAVCYKLFDYTLLAFAVYLFCFALLCLAAGWMEALAMDSVLISHFLTEKSFRITMVGNETGLFLIGTTVGILINLHLRRQEKVFLELSGEVDEQLKGILRRMADWLLRDDKTGYGPECFERLQDTLKRAEICAVSNYNNAILKPSSYELDYIHMRERQSTVLQGIYENIKSISYLPNQSVKVAELLKAIEKGYHRDNTVEGLLQELDALFDSLKREAMPAVREEFEARAILFYILKQLEKLLMIKREFILRN